MTDAVIGEEIDGYRFVSVIGRGGMGTVYKAEDVNLARTVAIKRINPSQANRESFIHRFRSEAQALARIDSPHIVGVHALRETDIGLLIVMEFVDGGTIKDPLKGNEPMMPAQAIPLLEQILFAFDDAHSAGVIHRDIKPQNIMLTREGTVKVTDFGIAKLRQPDSGETVTQGGQGGTLKYMSPEQISSIDDVDARSDLYSIGMTAYEMLAGRLPFTETDTDFDIMRMVVEGEIPPPDQFHPSLPSGLAQWIMGAIRTEQEDRYQDAEEMLEALRDADSQVDATMTQPEWEIGGESQSVDETQTVVPGDGEGETVIADPTSETVMGPPTAPSDTAPPEAPPDEPAEKELEGEERPEGTEEEQTEPAWGLIGGGVAAALLLVLGGYFAYAQLASSPPPELNLTTMPEEAVVFVDGERLGTTPLIDQAVSAGPLHIEVRKDGYAPLDTQLTAEAGGNVILRDVVLGEVETADSAPSSEENTTADGSGQDVAVSETERSQEEGGTGGPEAPPREGRETTADASSEDIQEGDEGVATEEPEATTPTATVDIEAEPRGTVTIDGEPREGIGPFEIPTGTHEVGCRHPSYGSLERTITVSEGESESFTCYFERELSVNVEGPWGYVWVDGEQRGSAPTEGPLWLSPGEHRIELRVESRGEYTVTGGNVKITDDGQEQFESFSGNTYTVEVEPSFTKTSYAILFQVE